jgi:hypothetical protein
LEGFAVYILAREMFEHLDREPHIDLFPLWVRGCILVSVFLLGLAVWGGVIMAILYLSS